MNLISCLSFYLLTLPLTLADVPGCFLENTSWSSSDILDLASPVPDYPQCQTICQDTTGCVAWTWTNENNLNIKLHCLLYASLGKKTFFEESVSGPVNCSCSDQYACTADEENKIDVIIGVEKEDECKRLCVDNDSCEYYTWYDEKSPITFLCFLLSSCDVTDYSCTGCYSGVPVCFEDVATTVTTNTTTTISTTTNAPMNTGIIISGGSSALKSVEVFMPGTGIGCTLPDLPDDKFYHTMDGLVLCGGDYGADSTGTSCLTFISGRWTTSHTLLYNRYGHSSWQSEEGLVLIGGRDSPTTTELLQGDHSVPYFDLKYPTRYACSIPDPATNTVIITGGLDTMTTVSQYDKDGWMEDLPSLNRGRWAHACSDYYRYDGTRVLLVAGGFAQPTEILVGSSATWTVTTNIPIDVRGNRAGIANNMLYHTGGSTYSGDRDDAIYQWDDGKEEWILTGRMIKGRSTHAVSIVTMDDDLINYCN